MLKKNDTIGTLVGEDIRKLNEMILDIKKNTQSSGSSGGGCDIKTSLPLPSLSYFKKSIYSIEDNAEYLCVANTEKPSEDKDCFWIQR